MVDLDTQDFRLRIECGVYNPATTQTGCELQSAQKGTR